jgi:hypothetical protein
MPTIVELIIDNNKYPVKVYHLVNEKGDLKYKCELEGSTISTFHYRDNYEGVTLDEALQKIAKELRRAINALLEF